jgi:hypothetical protein
MNHVTSWLPLLVMMSAVSGVTIASIVGAMVTIGRRAWRRIDAQLDDRVIRVVESATGPRFDALEDRLDRVESRLDRVDLRLDHLEGDMTIVKQRLRGVA